MVLQQQKEQLEAEKSLLSQQLQNQSSNSITSERTLPTSGKSPSIVIDHCDNFFLSESASSISRLFTNESNTVPVHEVIFTLAVSSDRLSERILGPHSHDHSSSGLTCPTRRLSTRTWTTSPADHRSHQSIGPTRNSQPSMAALSANSARHLRQQDSGSLLHRR